MICVQLSYLITQGACYSHVPSDAGPRSSIAWSALSSCFAGKQDSMRTISSIFTVDFVALFKHVHHIQFVQFTPLCGGGDLGNAAGSNDSNFIQVFYFSPIPSFLVSGAAPVCNHPYWPISTSRRRPVNNVFTRKLTLLLLFICGIHPNPGPAPSVSSPLPIILQLNCNGLKNSVAELDSFLNTKRISVAAIQESSCRDGRRTLEAGRKPHRERISSPRRATTSAY
jgi:hypothetical protein